MKKLTRDQKREIAAIAAKKDADIDLSEMPEVVDWSGAEVGKFYRPPKRRSPCGSMPISSLG